MGTFVDTLRQLYEALDKHLEAFIGDDSFIIHERGVAYSRPPKDGAILVETHDSVEIKAEWHPSLDRAKGALLLISRKRGRTPAIDGSYVDLGDKKSLYVYEVV